MNLLEKFNIVPKDRHLYDVAFTHGSYGTKHGLDYTYERLEFLGDSVLNMIVSEYLYKQYPDYEEGKLTKLRANYVCQTALIYYSHELGLDKHIKIYGDDSKITENEVLSITADVFESFLGAIFRITYLYCLPKEFCIPTAKQIFYGITLTFFQLIFFCFVISDAWCSITIQVKCHTDNS